MKDILKEWNKYLSEESDSSESISLKLPKFRISEQWGTPGSDDRKIIESFTAKIQGNTLQEKIASLNSFVTDCDAACAATKDVSEILANLVFLDALASVIYDFNPMTGGFLFESIISALFGGKSMQVPTGGGRYQDVTDIIDNNGRPMSLKFLFDGSGYVKGSVNNLERSIEDNGQPMYYLVGVKNRSHKDGKILAIDFYEFSVGLRRSDPTDFVYYDLGGNGINRSTIERKKYHIGTLNLGSRQEIQKVALKYTERLGGILIDLYRQMDELNNNVNKYFLNPPENKSSALKARNNALSIKQGTDEL